MMKLKFPGMRTIKTVLIVIICLIIARLFNLQYPFYAAIAGVICTQNTVHDSIRVAKNRVIGTILGSLLGILFVYMFSYNPWTSGIGILILLYFLKITKLEESYVVACVVYLATFIPGHGPAIPYGIERTIATILGILTALAVNLILSPPEYADDIQKISHKFVRDLFKSCGDFFILGKEIELSTVGAEIFKLEGLLKSYKLDIKRSDIKLIDTDKLDSLISNSKKVYNHLGVVNELNKMGYNCSLDEENAEYIGSLYDHEVAKSECEEACHNEVFNYHIKELIKYLDKFKGLKPDLEV